MWRAFFLAVGISMCIVGAECLAVERFELASEEVVEETSAGPATLFGSSPPPPLATSRDIEPPEWAPWSFLSAGAVVILYALTVNRGG